MILAGLAMVLPLVVILAQSVEGHPFWSSPVGVVIGWIGAIAVILAAVAGGIKGAQVIYRFGMDTHRWGYARYRERQRIEATLDELTSTEGWPGGASLKESHQALFAMVVEIQAAVARLEEVR